MFNEIMRQKLRFGGLTGDYATYNFFFFALGVCLAMNQPSNGSSPSTAVPLALLVMGGLIYGSFFSATRVAVDANVPPTALAFWQALLGALILLGLSLVMRDLPKVSWAHLRLYGAIGVFAFSIPLIALTFAAPNLPAGLLGLVLTLVPSLTYLGAMFARLEKFNWLSTLGLASGLVGVVIIVLSSSSVSGEFSGLWFMIALIAPLGYAMSNVTVALIRPAEATTIQLSTGVFVVAAPVLLIPMLLIDGVYFFSGANFTGFGAVLWSGITNVVIFITLFEVIYRRGPVFFLSVQLYSAPQLDFFGLI